LKLLVAPTNFRLAITSFSNRWYALVWSGMAIKGTNHMKIKMLLVTVFISNIAFASSLPIDT